MCCVCVRVQEQYVFVHDAILEYVTCGDTQITAGDLRRVMGKLAARNPQTQVTGYESQYKVSRAPPIALCGYA